MAVSKCVYPYPVLIIRDAETVEWREISPEIVEEITERWGKSRRKVTPAVGEMQPVRRDVRLSFYQPIEKPWDWSRARRLADACYASHGALSIEDPLGNVWLDGEQPAEHAPRPKAVPRSVLIEVINGYLAGKYGRADLAQVAA